MKKFEAPEIQVTTFAVEDIITASSGGAVPSSNDHNNTPWG